MLASIRPTPTKPILEDFIRTKLSYSAKKGETASIQGAKISLRSLPASPIPRELPLAKMRVAPRRGRDARVFRWAAFRAPPHGTPHLHLALPVPAPHTTADRRVLPV